MEVVGWARVCGTSTLRKVYDIYISFLNQFCGFPFGALDKKVYFTAVKSHRHIFISDVRFSSIVSLNRNDLLIRYVFRHW